MRPSFRTRASPAVTRSDKRTRSCLASVGYSRVSCVIPAFRQDLPSVIDRFERALMFLGGAPRRIVIDGLKACIDQSDPYTPRFNRTFLI